MLKPHIMIVFLTCLLSLHIMVSPAFAQAPAPQELLEAPKEENVMPPTQAEPGAQEPQTPENPTSGILDPNIKRIPDPSDQQENALPFDNYSDIPDEALKDAQDFYEFCKTDFIMSSHMDCRCLGSGYLEERIKAGPDAPRQQIMLTLNNPACLSVDLAAGYGYEKCQKNGMLTYEGGMTPEEYCECTGRNYALILKGSTGIVTRKTLSGAMTSSYLRCRPSKPGNVNIFRRLDQRPGEVR